MEIVIMKIDGFDNYSISTVGEVTNIKSGRKMSKYVGSNGYYQVFLTNNEGKQKVKKVHKLVADTFLYKIDSTQVLVVDHINGDRLDNRLCNLRIITNRENTTTRDGKYMTGVSFYKNRSKPYRANYKIKNKTYHIGYFETELDAHNAYIDAISKLN